MAQMPNGVHKRANSSVWQQRIMVPTDLRHLHGDRATVRVSLDTRDPNEARTRSRIIQAEWAERFG
jgi:hypothetical protein